MPPVMPYVNQFTGDASFYPPLRKKGRSERSVTLHRLMVSPENSIEDLLRIVSENRPFDTDNLATAIHKLAKLRRNQNVPYEVITEDPRWMMLIQQVVENGTAFIWPMRLLALVAWAVASLRERRITALLFDIAAKRLALGSVPQDLSSLAWAVATARAKDAAAAALLRQVSIESTKTVQSFGPQDLAMCAWAFAKVSMRDARLLHLFADEALEKYAELNGQNLSNLVWSLATIRENHEPLMHAVSRTRAETIQGLAQQEFSNVVWSFASLLRTSEMLFRRTAVRVVGMAAQLDSQHLANIAWAYAKISHRDDGLFYVLSREAMEPERKCSPLNLANLAWAFASAGWHGEMSTRRVGLRDPKFFEWVATSAVQIAPQFTSQNCSNLVWAFATMRIGHQELFEAMSNQVQGWLISNFDPQHLSNVLWSYAKLAIKNLELFDSAADEIVKRGVEYLARTPQNLSNTVWAYGVVASTPRHLMSALEHHLTAVRGFYEKLTEVRPLGKSSRAQLAMTVLSLHRLNLTSVAWHLFDQVSRDGLQAGGEAYSNWLFIAGETRNHRREVDVFEQMARTAHTRGLQAACWNAVAVRCLTFGDEGRAKSVLQLMDREDLCNPLSEVLRKRLGDLPAPSSVGNIDWRRREKDEHEWVTNSLGFSLRLNKIEYYKEVGTLHYILSHGKYQDVPVIHRAIEAFTREQELWLKLAGDEKGAVLDKVLALQGKAKLVVEVGLYVGYSSTRMASQMRHWGGRVISMEVDPYHAAIARNTIEWAGLTDYIEIWCGHSENLIPRLKERLPEKSIDILFFDQQGTKMHLDLQRIVDFNMLSETAIVVGDNVLRPGAPQFMYWNSVAGPYETQVVSLREYKQEVVEDWMSISFWLPQSPEARMPMRIPEEVEQLGHDTDGIRWQSVESKVSEQQWESHSQRMRREFAACGIKPFEVLPYQDAQGRSQVDLRPKLYAGYAG
ncbi:Catechol O-methyltransferase [Durusdinium trenchii]